MKAKLSFLFIITLNLIILAQVPKFTVEMKDEAKIWRLIENDKYLFLSSYEYSYLYELETGKKVYELYLDDYDKKGMKEIIDKYFFISVDNELHCYDILTGKQLWKQKYNFFEITKDSRYFTVTLDDAISIFDVENLKEIYRVQVKYDLDYSPIIPTEFGLYF